MIRLAQFGTFDVDNFGDLVFPRVAEHELARRRPAATVDAFSPFGRLHPTRMDGGRAASPLGPWTPGRADELADAYHCVVVGGGEIIHLNDPLLAPVYGAPAGELARLAPSRFFVEGLGPERERRCPVVWHAVGVPVEADEAQAGRLRAALASRPYVAVRDRFSRERLERAGVERELAVVPDSALLLDRIFPAAGLASHLDGLRAAGRYPRRPALVLQGCDLLAAHAGEVAAGLNATLARWPAGRPAGGGPPDVVIVETGPCRGDALFADAVEPGLAGRVWRLGPADRLEDIAAAVAGAEVFVGSSLHGAIAALVYGRPFVPLNLAGESKLDGFADLVGLEARVVHDAARLPAALARAVSEPVPALLLGRLQGEIDRHFDRIVDVAEQAQLARAAGGRPRRLSVARRYRAMRGRSGP